ncbi:MULTISPECIES: 3-hydroxyacyl-CoA dehydrogenase NAD-binding domain-containing protein [Rhodomicrobium]|uniref:3-hydroxyacyl-CoA dehydrogenase NAD-binding domain-containing protein n=1 Tax=Rhodomicrobium TaxID=1068 RepID=UPI000B4AADA8|nr:MULTISPECIES: 3-hydroxyacyl-CoA dehydrogenase NAD-binding domain-containing protein [Rhodomicrobium]
MAESLLNLKHWRFEIDFEKLAWATFDQAGESNNTFGVETATELESIVTAVEAAVKRGEIRGLTFLSAKKSFIVGADIREFDKLTREKDVEDVVRQLTSVFDRIELLTIPVVAGIHGYCLGGGLELAMACHYRIATRSEETRLGLPEVKLGIIPGLNGTVRFLQLAGPLDAMPAMLTGRMLRPGAARAMGLVDQLVPSPLELHWACRKAMLKNRRSAGASWWKRLMTLGPIRSLLANRMRKETAAKVREEHYPAPFKLIDLFDRFGGDRREMALAETRAFAPLMVSETSRNLRRVFRLSEMLKGEAPKNGPKFQRVHVIGAGTMGGDIAAWCVISGYEVSLQDMAPEAVDKALARAKSLFKKRLRGKIEVETAVARLYADVNGDHVPRADVVIEAVVEKLDIKQKVLATAEARMKPGALLATNTSSLPIEQIATGLADPGRLVGLHFFNPVPAMPLVEVVRRPNSREDVVRQACAFVAAIGKFPLIVKSSPGFLVNRVLGPYMFDALRRVEAGEAKEKIDAAAEKFGMPVGPIELADTVGLDICLNVAAVLGSPAPANSQLARLVAAGKLGKKTGSGFYDWVDGKAQKAPGEYDQRELEQLGKELVKPLIDECEKCLAEGVVADADHVDAGVIFGTGFAPFRGGPLNYRRSQGAPKPVNSQHEAAAAPSAAAE